MYYIIEGLTHWKVYKKQTEYSWTKEVAVTTTKEAAEAVLRLLNSNV